jgi:hypothetical protein
MNIGIVFVSTGGNKMLRALRSFRRMEPSLPVHITLDTRAKSWYPSPPLSTFESLPNVKVRDIENHCYVNGAMNAAMGWMRDLGYSHACLFHDDIIFSPFPDHHENISYWLERASSDPLLSVASGITLSQVEAITPEPGIPCVPRPAEFWDALDLESEEFWTRLHLNGDPPTYLDSVHQVFPPGLGWFIEYYGVATTARCTRLGSTGQIVPIATWEQVGRFDESFGVFYDMEYPVECYRRRLPPIYMIPNIPFLHLHNQSHGPRDPSCDTIFNDCVKSWYQKFTKEVVDEFHHNLNTEYFNAST